MKLPAEEPGTPLEPPGNRWPREMVIRDRIRLTGLLRKSPVLQGFSIEDLEPVHHRCITQIPTKAARRPVVTAMPLFMQKSVAATPPITIDLTGDYFWGAEPVPARPPETSLPKGRSRD
jgi:hypothetical protein